MQQLPKIVRSRLRTNVPPDHPDPDLLTAFAEGSLLGAERATLLDHVSHCTGCRELIILSAPELAPEIRAQVRPTAAWLRLPAFRWGALAASLAVIAAAVLLHQPKSKQTTEIAMQTAPAASAPPAAEPAPPARRDTTESRTAHETTRKKEIPQPSGGTEPTANTPETDALTAPAETANLAKQNAEMAAAAPPASSNENADEAKRPSSSSVAKTAPVFTARPTTETAASTIGGAKLADLRAPNWRLSDDGLPERSFNSGQWEKVKVDHLKGFRAIASQGMDVWLGGPAGALYHSDDMGLHWTRVSLTADGSALSDDITKLTFSDRLHGSFTTSTGAKWSTSDAGKTWQTQ